MVGLKVMYLVGYTAWIVNRIYWMILFGTLLHHKVILKNSPHFCMVWALPKQINSGFTRLIMRSLYYKRIDYFPIVSGALATPNVWCLPCGRQEGAPLWAFSSLWCRCHSSTDPPIGQNHGHWNGPKRFLWDSLIHSCGNMMKYAYGPVIHVGVSQKCHPHT